MFVFFLKKKKFSFFPYFGASKTHVLFIKSVVARPPLRRRRRKCSPTLPQESRSRLNGRPVDLSNPNTVVYQTFNLLWGGRGGFI